MNGRQTNQSHYLKALLKKSPISRNQIAAISGLSNPYIQTLEQGKITNVGREKLIALGIALNLNLSAIDNMLNVFDRAGLSKDDANYFLAATGRRKFSSALHPFYGGYTYDLLMVSTERIEGMHVLINSRPTYSLRSLGHRLYSEKEWMQNHPIYKNLITAIQKERYRLLLKNVASYPFYHYICQHCLEKYIYQCNDPEEKKWRKEHIKNTINMLLSSDNFHILLTKVCPNFCFAYKKPAADTQKTEQLIIASLPPQQLRFHSSSLLAGFATDNKALILNYKKELNHFKQAVIDEYTDRDKLINYLEVISK